MIAARKRPAFDFLVRRWVARAIRRRFHAVYLAGGEQFESLADSSTIGCVNHTNWWDGFVLYVLAHRRLRHDIYLAMDEANLRRYRFFTWLGVFGFDLTPGANNIAALRYAIRLLRGGKGKQPTLLWLFVQGALVNDRRPVEARPGASFLAQRSGVPLLPVALRYAWLSESRPSVFVRTGNPLSATASPEEIAASLNTLLAATDRTLDPLDLTGYEPLLAPGLSVNRRWDLFRHLLGRRGESFDKSNR